MRGSRETPFPYVRALGIGAAVLLAALLSGGFVAAPPSPASAQVFVRSTDPAHPRVRYADSLLSLNDRCPVRQGKLSTSYLPVYVNNHPVGFC